MIQVQALRDSDSARCLAEVEGRHTRLKRQFRALHSAYRHLRYRLEDMVSGPQEEYTSY